MEHDTDVVSCDWNPVWENRVATGTRDGVFMIWDVRSPQQPINVGYAGKRGIRRIKYLPCGVKLAAVGYNFKTT